MKATRLPGKMLLPLAGTTVLGVLVDRLRKCKSLSDIVVATTSNPADLKIVTWCRRNSVKWFRGSEHDVLHRMIECAEAIKANTIVDITGDCPLVDPRHVDHIVERFYKTNCDYASNVWPRTWPDGFDIQVYSREILQKVNGVCIDPIHRRHSGWNIMKYKTYFQQPLLFHNFPAPKECNYPNWAVTLDTPEDYELLKSLCDGAKAYSRGAEEIVQLLKDNSGLRKINSKIKRKEAGSG
jgi:spore coat polysaccharide biosynthesis protein SpsF